MVLRTVGSFRPFINGCGFFLPERLPQLFLALPVRLVGLRCDRQGRFVCGGINLENIDEPPDVWKPRARVYRTEREKGVRLILPDEVVDGEPSPRLAPRRLPPRDIRVFSWRIGRDGFFRRGKHTYSSSSNNNSVGYTTYPMS